MTRDVLFSEAIPLAFREDVERQIFYMSDGIDDFRLILGADGIAGVRVRVAPSEADPAAVEARIQAARGRYRGTRSCPRPERLWSHAPARTFAEGTFDRMRERGMAFQQASGVVAVDERFASLMDYFDAEIARMVKRRFGASEYRYPTLIPSGTMQRSGYLRSFPQAMMFVTRLHSSFDTYDAAMQENCASGYLHHCRETELCLPPAMCYHTYQHFADRMLPRTSCVVTARGKSFRFESKYERNLERLFDFTVREIVCLGPQAWATAERERLMAASWALMERWGLAGTCETATDPFFTNEEGADGSFVQRLMSLKYELRLQIDPSQTIAVASFNLHNDFFGSAFAIRLPDGTTARTACAGFGLERLAFAFLCQHGLDEARWPVEVRAALSHAVGQP